MSSFLDLILRGRKVTDESEPRERNEKVEVVGGEYFWAAKTKERVMGDE